MYWVALFVILRIFSNSFISIFTKELTKDGENPVFINFMNYAILAIVSSVALFFLNVPNNYFWVWGILGGISGALCNYLIASSLKHGELSTLSPLNSYKTIIGILLGIFFLREIPNSFGWLGILLIIAGTYFVFDTVNLGSVIKSKAVQYRFYALMFSAIEIIFMKKVILLSSVSVSVATTCIFGALFSYILLKLQNNQNCNQLKPRQVRLYLSTAVCFGIMTIFTTLVFKYMNVAYALSLFQLSILINVLYGWKVYKEHGSIRKVAGSLIIIFGVTTILLMA